MTVGSGILIIILILLAGLNFMVAAMARAVGEPVHRVFAMNGVAFALAAACVWFLLTSEVPAQ